MEEEEGWERVEQSVTPAIVEVFLGADAVVFGEDGGERDLLIS